TSRSFRDKGCFPAFVIGKNPNRREDSDQGKTCRVDPTGEKPPRLEELRTCIPTRVENWSTSSTRKAEPSAALSGKEFGRSAYGIDACIFWFLTARESCSSTCAPRRRMFILRTG